MELLERYLQAVRGYLLRRRRDDIVKELGDNIGSHVFTAGQIANAAVALGPLIMLGSFFCDGLLEATRLFLPRRHRGIVTHESNGIL